MPSVASVTRVALAAAVVASCSVSPATAAPAADLVTALPEFSGPFPSKHYSGYLNALDGSRLHYYWVDAAEVDPAKAPVVWWTNGGPGCSSMDGWGYELGPFHFANYGTSGPAFALNNFSWTKIANVVFVEDPPGVGFSYGPSSNYTTSDSQNAANNYGAVIDLLQNKFPEYASNEFYIAGESYAGIYVPTLARLILNEGKVANFAGVLVGNGVTSATYDDNFYWSDAVFAHGHGFLSDQTLEEVYAACVPPAGHPNSGDCARLANDYYTRMAPDVNTYDYTGNCFVAPQQSDLRLPAMRRRLTAHAKSLGVSVPRYIRLASSGQSLAAIAEWLKTGPEEWRAESSQAIPPSPRGSNVPCIDAESMTTYLNRADVKAALHVEPSLTWAICSDVRYVSDILDVVDVYSMLLAAGKRVLIYNGNVDMSVPYTGTEAWMTHETAWNVSTPLHGWSYLSPAFQYGPQQGGFARGFEKDQIWFTMINGAGHMVPQFRPAAAYAMFERFISGKGF
jgi:serine carboxypeptidase-like clade 1